MEPHPVCRHCGRELEPDGIGRYVSCCSAQVREPRKPVAEHGGSGPVRDAMERAVDVVADYPDPARFTARTLAYVVAPVVLVAMCCGACRWL